MEVVKAVQFRYSAQEPLLQLLKTFRDMVNEALRIGFEKKPRSRFKLITIVYQHFKERYGLHTHYILSACECAFAMLRNRRWKKRPYAKRLFLKLDNQTYQLNYMLLKIPVKPREYILIPLRGGDYQLSFLRDPALKRGSVTVTDATVVIAFRKNAEVREPLRKVGFDVNEKSLVSSDGERYDLSKAVSVGHRYLRIMASIARNTHSDRRIKQRLLAKYGERKRNRLKQALHKISKIIAEVGAGIVLERLTNIRNKHGKGNGEGRRMRGRLNRLPFRLLQSQIAYKAKWNGISVEYVGPSYTSKTCSHCGHINRRLKYEREWQCPSCGVILDRDINAARNILARSLLKEAAEVRRSDEWAPREGMVLREAIT